MEVCEGITSYMLSIENLLVGYDSTGHANYLVPFNYNSVQQYIDNTNMAISHTWGTDLEIICFCHMFNINLYSYDAGSNTWAVFSPVKSAPCVQHHECLLVPQKSTLFRHCLSS